MKLKVKKKIDYYLGGMLLLFLKPAAFLLGLALKRNHHSIPKGDIIIIKMLGGGSLVLAYPALISIKAQYPNLKLKLFTTQAIYEFGKVLNIFDEIICVNDSNIVQLTLTTAKGLFKIFRSDSVLDFEVYSRLTSVVSVLSCARNRFTFYQESVFWRRNLHTHLIYFNQSSNVCLFYNKMAESLGCKIINFKNSQNHFSKIPFLEQTSLSIKKYVAIGSTCSENGRERILTPEQWIKIIKKKNFLISTNFVLLGSPSEFEEINSLVTILKKSFPEHIFFNLAGKYKLTEVVNILNHCDEFLGVDSSLLHIARLLDKPCLSVWGPTDPKTRLTDMLLENETVIYSKIACSPCIHVTESPPCKGNNVCIQQYFNPNLEYSNYIPTEFS